MKTSKIMKGTLILTLFGFTGKALSALFRIGLVNIVGSTGMGIYGLIFPLFVFFTLLSCDGFSLGLIVNMAGNKLNGKDFYYKRYAFLIILSLSLLSFLFITLFSKFINNLQGGSAGELTYICLALSVVAVSVLGYFKAVLRGEEAIKAYSIVEVVEDISKVIIGLILAYLLKPFGVKYSVCGVFLGIFISALISILVCLIRKNKSTKKNIAVLLTKEEKNSFLRFSVFASLAALVVPFFQFIDSVLVINLLGGIGLSPERSTSLFGLSRGSVSALLNLPTFMLAAFEFLLLPSLTRQSGDKYTKKTGTSLGISLFISLPFVLLFYFFSGEIINILYGSALSDVEIMVCSSLLKIGSISLIFSGFTQIMVVGLEAKGNSLIPLVACLCAGIVKIMFMIFLVPKLSIYAVELASVLFSLIECLIIFVYAKICNLYSRPKGILLMAVFWGLFFLFLKLVIWLFKLLFAPFVAFILGVVLCVFVTIILLFVLFKANKKMGKLVIMELIDFD